MTWSCTHPIRPWLVIGLVLPVLTGCVADAASGVTTAVFEYFGGDGETRIEAEIAAAEDLNPDYNGDASPLVVRLYQLSSPTAFNNATFFQLYDGDVAELGQDLKGKEELELQPGQTLELERDLDPQTRFVGFIAGYRDIDNADWRAVTEIPPGETTDMKIEFRRLAVKIVEVD